MAGPVAVDTLIIDGIWGRRMPRMPVDRRAERGMPSDLIERPLKGRMLKIDEHESCGALGLTFTPWRATKPS